MIHQSKINYHENVHLEFPEGQIKKDMEINSLYH